MTDDRDTAHSSRALRLARVVALATATFGDRNKAEQWLRKSQPRFAGRTPLDIALTEYGAQLVDEALVQLDQGYFT